MKTKPNSLYTSVLLTGFALSFGCGDTSSETGTSTLGGDSSGGVSTSGSGEQSSEDSEASASAGSSGSGGTISDASTDGSGPTSDTGTNTDTGTEAPVECDEYDINDYLQFEEDPMAFTIDGNNAVLHGILGSTSPAVVSALIADHPQVDTIVMAICLGSEDDEANLPAAQQVHDAGLKTCVPANGEIASGGVDFFLAGSRRGVGDGGLVGVHSWATGEGTQGGDVPMDDPQHDLFLDYYEAIGFEQGPEFYWFTLQAAPAESIHWMTRAELTQYGVTKP